jgi:hypothetical protein
MNNQPCLVCGLQIGWMTGCVVYSGQQGTVELHTQCASQELSDLEPSDD